MEFRIVGPLEAFDGDRELSLGGPKPRALLALRLLHANEVVPSDRLIDGLYWRSGRRASARRPVSHIGYGEVRKPW